MSMFRFLAVTGAVLVLGASAQAALTSNALTSNALTSNVLTSNALAASGRPADASALADLNGVAVEGITLP